MTKEYVVTNCVQRWTWRWGTEERFAPLDFRVDLVRSNDSNDRRWVFVDAPMSVGDRVLKEDAGWGEGDV